MPPAPMNEPLMESSSWQIRHNAYGQSNKDFKLQCTPIQPRLPAHLLELVRLAAQ